MSARLDVDPLAHWLDTEGVAGAGERPVVERLPGGSQNELYSLSRGGERTVLWPSRIRMSRCTVCVDIPGAALVSRDSVCFKVKNDGMELEAEKRAELEAPINDPGVPANVATRARIVLWCAEGRP
ncbi:hypothetical protein AB1460_35730, partial [Parafrankia sp. FMc2]